MRKNGTQEIGTVGVVGLGLMGRGIVTCLLARGFKVIGSSRSAARRKSSYSHIDEALRDLVRRKFLKPSGMKDWRKRFHAVPSPGEMGECGFVIETVKEDLPVKREVFDRLESVLTPDAVIASNTSSIPITILQEGRKTPERFIGMHWGEPAQIMRYLEIIPGKFTSPETVRRTALLGELCGKEPSVLNFDIRGFVSNRMMYAMMREACYLLEAGVADMETIDRSFRNDIGWWATIAGPFRWMDLTGIPAYATVMQDLFPQLANTTELPKVMRETVDKGAEGISNARGFYKYTRASARKWERAWVDFTYDIRRLVDKYERRVKSGREKRA
jgi:3-hydroxyacyl-CoA dehydrogenase